MSDATCREMYLNEYIDKYVEDETVKKRMIDLYEVQEKELHKCYKWLNNCHERIDELERALMELSVIIGQDKKFIREQIRNE